MSKIQDILRMIKFSHTVFAFPFAIISFLVNKTHFPDYKLILFISLALVFARSAAMAFNRLIDYKYDKENPRTTDREIVTGKLKKKEVIVFTLVASLAFIASSYFINDLCFILSPFLLAFLLFYSFWKRFSSLCHLYLGMVIGLAPIGVDIALNRNISVTSLLLFLSVTFWVFGFDIIYSLLDIEFDKKAKLHSLPKKIGSQKALLISKIGYASMMMALIILGFIHQEFGIIYYLGLVVISILLAIQHIWVKPDDFSKVNRAFFTLNSLISVVFLVFSFLDWYI